MHASLHQLLNLRDEVIADSAVISHVRECAECRTELDRLRGVTAELRNLPSQLTAPGRWAAIAQSLASTSLDKQEKKQPGWLWPMATAAVVALAVTLLTWKSDGVYELTTTSVRTAVAPVASTQPEEDQSLVAESRELEQMLAALPQERAAVRASTALTLADLQDRIQWVDYRLQNGEEAGLQPDQSQQLWQERVDLLNSLVAVRYAESRTAF